MRVETKTLTGPALAWALAECEGHKVGIERSALGYASVWLLTPRGTRLSPFDPEADWSISGPILERMAPWVRSYKSLCFSTEHLQPPERKWVAEGTALGPDGRYATCFGASYLQAGLRCCVATKKGPEVEVPDELFTALAPQGADPAPLL